MMMLPEVLSKLKTDHFDQDFAEDGDYEKELALRESAWWGRLYIEGWPQPLQYFRAHFGAPPPQSMHPIVLADPLDACSAPINGILMKKLNAIVLASRGNCTFSKKAKVIAETSAASVIFMNTEPGNMHVPGPDAHDLEFPVSMITKDDGDLVVSALRAGQLLMGAQVPIHCFAESKVVTNEYCRALLAEERDLISQITHGGWIKFHATDGETTTKLDSRREFLLAKFGVKVPPDEFNIVTAQPKEACTNVTNPDELRGKAVLVHRGQCDFEEKARHVFDANPAMIIMVNSETHLLRPGVDPRWLGLKYDVPVIMVTDRGGRALASTTGPVSFSISKQVNSTIWDALQEAGTNHDTQQAAQLRLDHVGWPDRQDALDHYFPNERSREEL